MEKWFWNKFISLVMDSWHFSLRLIAPGCKIRYVSKPNFCFQREIPVFLLKLFRNFQHITTHLACCLKTQKLQQFEGSVLSEKSHLFFFIIEYSIKFMKQNKTPSNKNLRNCLYVHFSSKNIWRHTLTFSANHDIIAIGLAGRVAQAKK